MNHADRERRFAALRSASSALATEIKLANNRKFRTAMAMSSQPTAKGRAAHDACGHLPARWDFDGGMLMGAAAFMVWAQYAFGGPRMPSGSGVQ